MTFSYRRLVLHPFVVLLLLVAMVFATAADAAACGAEVAPGNASSLVTIDAAHSVSESDQDQDDTGAPAEQHGVCAHGHCHHGATFMGAVQKDQLPHPPVIVAPSAHAALFSNVSDQLKRPPRV